MAKSTIEVIKFTAHKLHDQLSIVVIHKVTDDNLKDRVLEVHGPIDDAGDHLHLTEQKNLLGRNPKSKFHVRQRATRYMAHDITEAFEAMVAALSEAEEAPQETAPVKLTLVK